MDSRLLIRATKQSRVLSIFNKVVLAIALLVYLFFAISIVETGEWFGFIPLTSVLLGVMLIHIFVEVALNHFALLRESVTQSDE